MSADHRTFRPGSLVTFEGLEIAAGAKKNRTTVLILQNLGESPLRKEGEPPHWDYLTCEVSHFSVYHDDEHVKAEQMGNGPVRDILISFRNLNRTSINADSFAESSGHISHGQMEAVQRRIRSEMVIDGRTPKHSTWAEFPYTDGTGRKQRPCLILFESKNSMLVCGWTSKGYNTEGKVIITGQEQPELYQTSPTGESAVQTTWLRTVPKPAGASKGNRHFGSVISGQDLKNVMEALSNTYINTIAIVLPPKKPHYTPEEIQERKQKEAKIRMDAKKERFAKRGIDISEPITTREEAAKAVRKHQAIIIGGIITGIKSEKMFNVLRNLTPEDLIGAALFSFLKEGSKTAIPTTVGGVIEYFTAAGLNKARSDRAKTRRDAGKHGPAEFDSIPQEDHRYFAQATDSVVASNERADNLRKVFEEIAVTATEKEKNVLMSLQEQVNAVDEDEISRVTDAYGARLAGMTVHDFKKTRARLAGLVGQKLACSDEELGMPVNDRARSIAKPVVTADVADYAG